MTALHHTSQYDVDDSLSNCRTVTSQRIAKIRNLLTQYGGYCVLLTHLLWLFFALQSSGLMLLRGEVRVGSRVLSSCMAMSQTCHDAARRLPTDERRYRIATQLQLTKTNVFTTLQLVASARSLPVWVLQYPVYLFPLYFIFFVFFCVFVTFVFLL